MLRRIFWLAVFIVGLGYPIFSGLRQVHREEEIRSMLLMVQTSLQDYHVDQERYIPREKLTGTEVISVLSDFGFLNELPPNPWSGTAWKLDGEEPDYLVYETDPNFETYALKALDPKSGEVVMELDSEENPSPE